MKYFTNGVSDLLINFKNIFHIYTKQKEGNGKLGCLFWICILWHTVRKLFAVLCEAYSVAGPDILF